MWYTVAMKFFKSSKLFGKHSSYKRKAAALINKKLGGNGRQRLQPFSVTAKRVSNRGKGLPNPGLVTIQYRNGKILVRK